MAPPIQRTFIFSHWMIRKLEFLALLFSFLWSYEAFACEVIKVHTKKHSRTIASYVEQDSKTPNLGFLLEKKPKRHAKITQFPFLNAQNFRTPGSVADGQGLSHSFKSSPYFTPTEIQVVRFKLF